MWRPPLAHNVTRSNRLIKLTFLVLVSLSLVGCGGPPPVANGPKEATAAGSDRLLTADQIESPLAGAESELGLINESQILHIGDSAESVFSQDFPRPERAANVTQMPPGLDTSFRARGWESANQAFGVVLKGGRVALALLTTENEDEEGLGDIVTQYESRFGTPERVGSAGVRYWFWQDRDVRLMVCCAYDEDGKMAVTSAIGLKTLMSFLRMDVQDARGDREEAERLRRAKEAEREAAKQTPATN